MQSVQVRTSKSPCLFQLHLSQSDSSCPFRATQPPFFLRGAAEETEEKKGAEEQHD